MLQVGSDALVQHLQLSEALRNAYLLGVRGGSHLVRVRARLATRRFNFLGPPKMPNFKNLGLSRTMVNQERLNSELIDAVFNQDINNVKLLLDAGADVNAVNEYGFTNLYYAASECNMEIVQLLMSRGADPNLSGNPQTLNDGAKPLHGIAHIPIENACYPIAEFLIKRGADVNAKDNLNDTPLHHAAFRGNSTLISIFIRNGADVNKKGGMIRIPLHNNAYGGDLASCKLLVEAGSNVNSQDSEGKTPLHIAAEKGHPDICRYLVEAGANLEVEDERGDTPFHSATRKSSREPILLLLYELGANPFHKNKEGQTALDIAKAWRQYFPEVVETLKGLEKRYRKKMGWFGWMGGARQHRKTHTRVITKKRSTTKHRRHTKRHR